MSTLYMYIYIGIDLLSVLSLYTCFERKGSSMIFSGSVALCGNGLTQLKVMKSFEGQKGVFFYALDLISEGGLQT